MTQVCKPVYDCLKDILKHNPVALDCCSTADPCPQALTLVLDLYSFIDYCLLRLTLVCELKTPDTVYAAVLYQVMLFAHSAALGQLVLNPYVLFNFF